MIQIRMGHDASAMASKPSYHAVSWMLDFAEMRSYRERYAGKGIPNHQDPVTSEGMEVTWVGGALFAMDRTDAFPSRLSAMAALVLAHGWPLETGCLLLSGYHITTCPESVGRRR
ncbi:hypothetical protein JKG47_10470 [Acidithiobacillus sp. MC6.1]|nr:hypothetical protein [Acidithiobacillus sp. MC6.1]